MTGARKGGSFTGSPAKIGVVAAGTEVIDELPAVAELGPRFVYVRSRPLSPAQRVAFREAAGAVAERDGLELAAELGALVGDFVEGTGVIDGRVTVPRLGADLRGFALEVGDLAARCRTPALRLTVPDPEAPSRLPQALTQMARMLAFLGLDDGEVKAAVLRVGHDSVPKTRVAILRLFMGESGEMMTGAIADRVGLATEAIREVAQGMAAAGLLLREGGASQELRWRLTPEARASIELLDFLSPGDERTITVGTEGDRPLTAEEIERAIGEMRRSTEGQGPGTLPDTWEDF